jgi:hypothetical protein
VAPEPGQRLCDCDIASSDEPAWLGYYRLLPGTTVRVQDASGREAVFDGLDARLEPGSGLIALRVEKRDLPPASRVAARSVPDRTRSHTFASRAPVTVPEPVSEQPIAAAVEEPVLQAPLPEPEPAPPPPPEKKQPAPRSSPVSGFLPTR